MSNLIVLQQQWCWHDDERGLLGCAVRALKPHPPHSQKTASVAVVLAFPLPLSFLSSAGTVDYLVDALALHDQLHLLRPVMADPAVLKVLHGGANDIAWLQRDAHVYLVNVFDTEKAAQVRRRRLM